MATLHPLLENHVFTYDDIIVNPSSPIRKFERDEVDLTTKFTKDITLKNPLVSSPMDTVTNADVAILLALTGNIGVLHYNYPSIQAHIDEVEKVKRFQAKFVREPICLKETDTIGDVYRLNEIYGFYSAPITVDGTWHTPMVGFVSHRDVRYREDKDTNLKHVMTPREKLVTEHRRDTLDKNDIRRANATIKEHNLDTLPIVDDLFCPVALVTDSDIKKNEMFPLATKDEYGRLRVFVAVESRLEGAKKRIGLAYEAGADGYITDSRSVFRETYEIFRYSKSNFPRMQTVPGNLASPELVKAIMREAHQYVDALRIGVGQGDACDTPAVVGLGSLQASAVYYCARMIKELEKLYGPMPIIADGDVKIPADVIKALALGPSSVMCGSIFSRLGQAPGIKKYVVIEKEVDRKPVRDMVLRKDYRGMASPEAMEAGGAARYGLDRVKIRVPEGHRRDVELLGSGYDFIPYFVTAIKQGMQGVDARNIEELQEKAYFEPSKYFRGRNQSRFDYFKWRIHHFFNKAFRLR